MLGLTFLAVFAMALRISADTDTWWQLRTGEVIVRGGEIPKADTFSHTREGATWLYPSAAWLSEAQLYALMAAFGPGGLNVWVAALVTLAFFFIYKSLSGGLFLGAFATVLAAAASGVYWAARPYMWSFVFSAIFIFILEQVRWRGRTRLLWWLPAILLAWANSHPGFAVGFILLAIYAADFAGRWLASRWQRGRLLIRRGDVRRAWAEWGRPFALVAAAMLLAVCINPSGPVMLRYPFDTVSMGVLGSYIQEWQSPNFHEARIIPFAVLLGLTLVTLAASKLRVALSDLLLLGVFGGMSLLAARNIALFALAAPVVLTRYAAPLLAELDKKYNVLRTKRSRPFKGQRALNAGIFATLLVAVAAKASLVLPAEANWAAIEKNLPLGAVRFLDVHQPPGELFNSYNWGGFLIWELPEYPVFADGRTDLYGDELLGEWLSIANAEDGWQAKLQERGVRLVLLEPSWALSKLLPAAGWQLLYADELSVLYGLNE